MTPASVDDMARLGVKTSTSRPRRTTPGPRATLVDRKLVGDILRRAHRHGVQVVAWYLPHFADVDRDLRYIERDVQVPDARASGSTASRSTSSGRPT